MGMEMGSGDKGWVEMEKMGMRVSGGWIRCAAQSKHVGVQLLWKATCIRESEHDNGCCRGMCRVVAGMCYTKHVN
jgi:hypothetical protein